MIDAKTARKISDDLNSNTNQTHLTIIESKIAEASSKGKYAVAINEKYVNETIIFRLTSLGYKVDKKSGFYDQRDPQGSVDPYYTIAWG